MARTQKLSCVVATFTCTDENGEQHEFHVEIDEKGSINLYVNGAQFPCRQQTHTTYGALSSCNSLLDKLCYMEKVMNDPT